MTRYTRLVGLMTCLSLLSPALTVSTRGQGRGEGEGTKTAQPREPQGRDEGGTRTAQPREPRRRAPEPARPPTRPTVVLRGHVFIGGYFYDPVFGPYPWWTRHTYPYWYYPVYDNRAELRVMVTPRDAAVYVDGFYAGIVDDFDGVFQPLHLPPGGHQIALYRDGFRTAYHNVYLRAGSTMKLHDSLVPLPRGVRSEPPPFAPPVPPPPVGTYRSPRTPPPAGGPPPPQVPGPATQAEGFGTLEIRVQPAGADVTIDGERWLSSDEGKYVLQVQPGVHRVEASREGYQRFSMEVEAIEGETTPLNVSLMPARPK